METAQFLFPQDLEVTPSDLKGILFIGSCLSEAYVKRIREENPDLNCEHILFNNATELPRKSPEEAQRYDLQYIQLALRSVLTDFAVRVGDKERGSEKIDWLEIGKSNIDVMLDKAMNYNIQHGLLTLVSTFILPQVRVAPSLFDARTAQDLTWVTQQLNDYLAQKVRNYENAYIADVETIAAALGKQYFLDDFIVFYTHGSVHYPDWEEFGRVEAVPPFVETYENRATEFFRAVYRQIEHLYRVVKQLDQVKVVIFDLDNTMWRGQLAEHYQQGIDWPHTHGWPLGIWETVHHLRWRGIAVALASKNDEEIVVARWGDIVDPPFVTFEDFIIKEIGWQPKTESVSEILKMLSLTAKSAVFVDDHPVERAAVKAAFPEIRVIGSNPYLTRRILLWSAETQLPMRTPEARRREEMFTKQIQREQDRKTMSHEMFLASLKSEIFFFELSNSGHPSYPRVNELVNKTNQFNTALKRWALEDYNEFWGTGGRIFSFSVKDRFTDYGLVGVIFATRDEIVQYVLSCRVLGMDIEIAALSYVVRLMRSRGAASVFGSVISTDVNIPCRDVFLRCGFTQSHHHPKRFELNDSTVPVSPAHVHVSHLFPQECVDEHGGRDDTRSIGIMKRMFRWIPRALKDGFR